MSRKNGKVNFSLAITAELRFIMISIFEICVKLLNFPLKMKKERRARHDRNRLKYVSFCEYQAASSKDCQIKLERFVTSST